MGVPQGFTNNIEYLQRVLEGLTEATSQEREDNATARAQNKVLQAAVNALQFQTASVGQGGPAINGMQMRQPQHAQMQENQIMGQHQNRNMSGPPTAPHAAMAGNTGGPNTAMSGTAAQLPAMDTIPTVGSISATQQPTFSTNRTWQGPWQCSRTQHNGTVSTRLLPGRGPSHATPATEATT